MFADGADLRESEWSITSSCNNDAVCISSVISANLRCEGRISESPDLYIASSVAVKGAHSAADGFASLSRGGGDMAVSIPF